MRKSVKKNDVKEGENNVKSLVVMQLANKGDAIVHDTHLLEKNDVVSCLTTRQIA